MSAAPPGLVLNPAVVREAAWRDGALTMQDMADVAAMNGLALWVPRPPRVYEPMPTKAEARRRSLLALKRTAEWSRGEALKTVAARDRELARIELELAQLDETETP